MHVARFCESYEQTEKENSVVFAIPTSEKQMRLQFRYLALLTHKVVSDKHNFKTKSPKNQCISSITRLTLHANPR
jgi:hypothetical protein